jgi:hypothetical protein
MPGLNTTFEYTIVASIPMVVSGVSANTFTASFTTLPGGTWYILNQNPPNSDVASGVGFDDGTIAANGTINAGQPAGFTEVLPANGTGAVALQGLVDYANPAFLDPASTIFDFRLNGTLSYPTGMSTTASFFGDGVYPEHIVQSNDLLLRLDGASQFSTIPEPSTMWLLSAGLGALGLAAWRRIRITQRGR